MRIIERDILRASEGIASSLCACSDDVIGGQLRGVGTGLEALKKPTG